MSDAAANEPPPEIKKGRIPEWGLPALRVLVVAGIAFLAWYVAGHWNRWTGAARYESTDDAYMSGDITPLSAKVSGYIEKVAVGDYQSVRKGDLIVQIVDFRLSRGTRAGRSRARRSTGQSRQSRQPEGHSAFAHPPGRSDHCGNDGGPRALHA
jgi:multidrug resistance efflux pump